MLGFDKVGGLPGVRGQGRGGIQHVQVSQSADPLLVASQLSHWQLRDHAPTETPSPATILNQHHPGGGNMCKCSSTFISEDGECAEVGLEGGWLRLLACCWLMPC